MYDRDARELVIKPLENEMCLAVTVPVSEIEKVSNQLLWQMIFITIVITIIFVFITIFITGNIIRPLKELNATAKKIANGNLDISLTCKSTDEVGTLAESIKETARQLKLHMDYINNLAYTDKLTGVQNNTAYLKKVSDINDNIADENLKFTVFVIDINGLKYVNDTYGHNCGNELIIAASEKILKVFNYENVYRIGGDEFAVIMLGIDEAKSNKLATEFRDTIERGSGEIRVYAAIGYSAFIKGDGCYEDVFMRADENMYKNKELMKSSGKNSDVN